MSRMKQRYLTHDGETMTIIEWSKRTGLDRTVIHNRLRYGWTVEETLTTPKMDFKDCGMMGIEGYKRNWWSQARAASS